MKPASKAALVAALRSGQYKKTEGDLHAGDCYCALGVFCVINGAEFVKSASAKYKGERESCFYIPDNLAAEHELTGEQQGLIVNFNDGTIPTDHDGGLRNSTFAEVADEIERNPEL